MIHALCYFAEKRMLLAFKLAQGLRKSKSLFVQEAVVCTIQKIINNEGKRVFEAN